MAARKKASRSGAAKKRTAGATAKSKAASRKTPARVPSAKELSAAMERLESLSARLERALDEVPRVSDFEPLAEHLYSFATLAPRLMESLEELPRIVEPIEGSVRSLRELAETLQYAHESFSEALLKLPRADDFEPLAEPLREFARVAPALAESLSEVLRTTRPLGETVKGLQQIADSLLAMQEGMASFAAMAMHAPAAASPATAAGSPTDGEGRRVLEQVAARTEEARDQILGALATLPRDPDYARVAGRLKEMATQSPELAKWIDEARGFSTPLGESISGLEASATALTSAHLKLTELLKGRHRQA